MEDRLYTTIPHERFETHYKVLDEKNKWLERELENAENRKIIKVVIEPKLTYRSVTIDKDRQVDMHVASIDLTIASNPALIPNEINLSGFIYEMFNTDYGRLFRHGNVYTRETLENALEMSRTNQTKWRELQRQIIDLSAATVNIFTTLPWWFRMFYGKRIRKIKTLIGKLNS